MGQFEGVCQDSTLYDNNLSDNPKVKIFLKKKVLTVPMRAKVKE